MRKREKEFQSELGSEGFREEIKLLFYNNHHHHLEIKKEIFIYRTVLFSASRIDLNFIGRDLTICDLCVFSLSI
jgi:predicted DNA-binding transcriptional regulator